MTKIVAIDGGFKKDTQVGISAMYYGDNYLYNLEKESTVQRAEIHGLILALRYSVQTGPVTVISDSQYVTHTIQKEWYKSWSNKGWVTAANEEVKNKDLWMTVEDLMEDVEDFSILHVSSHAISIGKAGAHSFISDRKFGLLEKILHDKYDRPISSKVTARLTEAKEKFKLLNDIDCPEQSFRQMIVYNTLVDSVVEYIKGGL